LDWLADDVGLQPSIHQGLVNTRRPVCVLAGCK
jgi:hypothetical protein